MPLDSIAPGPFREFSGLIPVIVLVVVVVILLGFALWRYSRKRG
jgi:hypothetical protein